ncbi:hypothetical protein BDZ91DRAFT_35675 [Kalaharituber pfeilii]|nr:hypothetical protein BDZ91DRAFT_35675 [Kalaharituber pfeilii]
MRPNSSTQQMDPQSGAPQGPQGSGQMPQGPPRPQTGQVPGPSPAQGAQPPQGSQPGQQGQRPTQQQQQQTRPTPKIYNPQTGEYETYDEIQARLAGKAPPKPVTPGILRVYQAAPGEPKYDPVPIPQGYHTTQGEYVLRGSGLMQSPPVPSTPGMQPSTPGMQQGQRPMSGYQGGPQGRQSPVPSIGRQGPPDSTNQYGYHSPHGSISAGTARSPAPQPGPAGISIQYEDPRQQGQGSQVSSVSPDTEGRSSQPSPRTPGDPVLPASVRRAGSQETGFPSPRSPPPPRAQSPAQANGKVSPIPGTPSQYSSSTTVTTTPVIQQAPIMSTPVIASSSASSSPAPQAPSAPVAAVATAASEVTISSAAAKPENSEVRITPPSSPDMETMKYPVNEPVIPEGAQLPIVHPEFADEKIPVFDEEETDDKIVMSATAYPGQAWEPECFWMDN